jgi:ribosomal protein L37E
MKQITGKVYRKEGKDRERLYTEITCLDCGAKTYERKKEKIEQALHLA